MGTTQMATLAYRAGRREPTRGSAMREVRATPAAVLASSHQPPPGQSSEARGSSPAALSRRFSVRLTGCVCSAWSQGGCRARPPPGAGAPVPDRPVHHISGGAGSCAGHSGVRAGPSLGKYGRARRPLRRACPRRPAVPAVPPAAKWIHSGGGAARAENGRLPRLCVRGDSPPAGGLPAAGSPLSRREPRQGLAAWAAAALLLHDAGRLNGSSAPSPQSGEWHGMGAALGPPPPPARDGGGSGLGGAKNHVVVDAAELEHHQRRRRRRVGAPPGLARAAAAGC